MNVEFPTHTLMLGPNDPEAWMMREAQQRI